MSQTKIEDHFSPSPRRSRGNPSPRQRQPRSAADPGASRLPGPSTGTLMDPPTRKEAGPSASTSRPSTTRRSPTKRDHDKPSTTRQPPEHHSTSTDSEGSEGMNAITLTQAARRGPGEHRTTRVTRYEDTPVYAGVVGRNRGELRGSQRSKSTSPKKRRDSDSESPNKGTSEKRYPDLGRSPDERQSPRKKDGPQTARIRGGRNGQTRHVEEQQPGDEEVVAPSRPTTRHGLGREKRRSDPVNAHSINDVIEDEDMGRVPPVTAPLTRASRSRTSSAQQIEEVPPAEQPRRSRRIPPTGSSSLEPPPLRITRSQIQQSEATPTSTRHTRRARPAAAASASTSASSGRSITPVPALTASISKNRKSRQSTATAPGRQNRKRKAVPPPLDLSSGKRARVLVIELPTLSAEQRSAYTLHTAAASSQPTITAPVVFTPAQSVTEEVGTAVDGQSDAYLDELLQVDEEEDPLAAPLNLPKPLSPVRNVEDSTVTNSAGVASEIETPSDLPPAKNGQGKKGPQTAQPPVRTYATKSAGKHAKDVSPQPSRSASDSSGMNLRDPETKSRKMRPAAGVEEEAPKSGKSGRGSKSSRSGRPTNRASNAPKGKPKQRASKAEEDHDAETDSDDAIDDLAYDEPERFKATSRLRKKTETSFQRNLRKMRAARMGQAPISDSSSEESYTSDSAASSGSEDFIVDDGGAVQEGLLPHQFSHNSAQTPEFKFKVVYHYLVLLVVKGPRILPLSGETADYFLPMVRDLRRRMEGYKSSRVRSQIWRSDFVRALETFPTFRGVFLDFPEPGCDACHLGGRRSTWRVYLEGDPYDKETHEPIDSDSESDSASERGTGKHGKRGKMSTPKLNTGRGSQKQLSRRASSDDSSSSSEDKELPREFRMGRMCKRRSECYHQMTHWEDELYYRIRGYYRDLLRALYKTVPEDSEESSSDSDSEEDPDEAEDRRARRRARRAQTQARVARLRKRGLCEAYKDVGEVTEWMDGMGYQAKDFKWLEDLVTRSEMLEHDTERDD